MDLSRIGVFKLMKDKMAWNNQRQEVLAQNVANADTPGYKPRDLVEFDFRKELRDTAKLQLAGTSGSHLTGTLPDSQGFKSDKARTQYETTPAGNAVVLEEQMMKVGQNSMEYQSTVNLYRKQLALLKTALSKGV
ncbi:MAG TPA: flagellar basal body rod protein FlgB [Azospirillaceae bacterium]|nr:flagellar basal body rod protein FlgB [Azospirillaceae bacterium]